MNDKIEIFGAGSVLVLDVMRHAAMKILRDEVAAAELARAAVTCLPELEPGENAHAYLLAMILRRRDIAPARYAQASPSRLDDLAEDLAEIWTAAASQNEPTT